VVGITAGIAAGIITTATGECGSADLFSHDEMTPRALRACFIFAWWNRDAEHDSEKRALGLDPMGGNRFSLG
jgi:hypothetical protein